MSEPFTLRPMTDADGEAVRHLMEDDPDSGGMQVTARFVLDPVKAWRALKPDMEGVVAVAPDGRMLGTATVSFEDVQYNGRVMASAYLENLRYTIRRVVRGSQRPWRSGALDRRKRASAAVTASS
jgi:hypothetical protein